MLARKANEINQVVHTDNAIAFFRRLLRTLGFLQAPPQLQILGVQGILQEHHC
jgi:hypothetical protein